MRTEEEQDFINKEVDKWKNDEERGVLKIISMINNKEIIPTK
jgi:hypothetical protein